MASRILPTATAIGRMLSVLHRGGPMTRAEATARTHLARSAAGEAVDELVSLGLVRSRDAARTGARGRPSAELRIVTDAATAVTVSVGRNGAELCLVNLSRLIVAREAVSIAFNDTPPEVSLATLADTIERFIQKYDDHNIQGIGISLPGMVDAADGVALAVLPLNWRNVPVVSYLRQRLRLPLPLTLGHDAALGTIAEFRMGSTQKSRRLLSLTGEAFGVGAGLVMASGPNSQLADHALQAGHLIVIPDGPQCSCGSRGCLELYVDGRALRVALDLPLEAGAVEIERILKTLTRHEADLRGLDKVAEILAIALISLVNTLGPDVVVLAGLLAPLAGLYDELLQTAVRRAVVAQVEEVRLTSSTLADAVAIGAAEVALEPFLADPSPRAIDQRAT